MCSIMKRVVVLGLALILMVDFYDARRIEDDRGGDGELSCF